MALLITASEADAQIERIDAWWRANRPAAPGLFGSELAGAFALLEDAPDIGHRYRRRGIPGVRRFLLPGTKYHVYYIHDERADMVIVLAVWSAVRGRGPRLRMP